MIYGYDEAVRYPVKDLYDTGMMNLYIGAIKDEYERGLKEQEEFVSKYGDFISPFQKDVESWDNLTMDPFIETYDYLVKNGIDPLRSQEGRAAMAQVRRNVPREKLSMLRQSAAAGQEYLKNRGEMQAKGLYNPEFEQFLLGDRTFNDQDTLSQGMWSRTSPTEFKGLRTLTDPWFKHRTAKFDAELTKKKNDGFQYYTYTRDDMYKAANDQIQAFLGNDYGRFYYDRALKVAEASRQPGESDESVRKRAQDILINDITDINRDYLMEDRKTDPYAMAELEYRNRLRLAGIQRQWAKEDAEEERRNLYPASWTGMLTNDVNKQRGDRNYSLLLTSVQYLINQNKKQKGKYKKGTKQYNFHAAQEKYYSDYLKNIQSGKAGYKEDRLGIKHLTDTAEWAIKYYQKHKPGRSTLNDQTDWLNNNSFEISEPNSRDWAFNFVSTGKTKISNAMGGQEERGVITFGGNNNLLRVRTGQLSGKPLSSNSISSKLNKYLRNNKVQGYVNETSIKVSKSPRSNGGATYDFTYYVDIPRSVMEDFIRKQEGWKADATVDDDALKHYLKPLGASSYTSGTDKSKYTMVRIPATTTANESRLNSYQNSMIDKQIGGTSNAWNMQPTRQTESIELSNAM